MNIPVRRRVFLSVAIPSSAWIDFQKVLNEMQHTQIIVQVRDFILNLEMVQEQRLLKNLVLVISIVPVLTLDPVYDRNNFIAVQ